MMEEVGYDAQHIFEGYRYEDTAVEFEVHRWSRVTVNGLQQC
jgi:hypothetical protein